MLDVGCGEGILARRLSDTVGRVVAIDVDGPTIEQARRESPAENVDYIVGDFLASELEPASFDAVVSVAALHHMDTASALERMRLLLGPNGALVVVGLARSRSAIDFAFDAAGAIANRFHKMRQTYWESAAPKIWPPPATYAETRRIAMRTLPGARFRRHVLWRYSIVWTAV